MNDDFLPVQVSGPEPSTAVDILVGTAAFVLICCAPAIIWAVWRWAL